MPSVPKELKGLIPPRRVEKKKKRLSLTPSQREAKKKEFLEEYRKDDAKLNKTAELIDVSRQVIYKWASTDPDFAREFEELRYVKKHKSQEAFDEKHKYDEVNKKRFLELYEDETYSVASALKELGCTKTDMDYWTKTDFEFKKAYKALQLKTRPAMARLAELKTSLSSAEMIEKHKEFIKHFKANHFNITKAAEAMGVRRATVVNWGKEDPDFAAQIAALMDEKVDYVEDKLYDLIDQGSAAAAIFTMKCIGNKEAPGRHAYIEQPQKIEGYVQHDHKHSFDQDQLDAMVRGQLEDRQKYEDLLQLDDPNIIDVEIKEEDDTEEPIDIDSEIESLKAKLEQLERLKNGK